MKDFVLILTGPNNESVRLRASEIESWGLAESNYSGVLTAIAARSGNVYKVKEPPEALDRVMSSGGCQFVNGSNNVTARI